MANTSIYAAFERMWQHVVAKLGEKSNSDHNHDDAYCTPIAVAETYETKEDATAKLQEAKSYADQVKSDIYGGVPNATLDTLTELATAFTENKEVVDTLDAAITNKVDKNVFDEHKHSWNDLEDRPFYEEIVNVSLLDNASFMLSETNDEKTFGSYILQTSDYIVLEENKEYTIVVNGTSYNAIARSYSESGMIATYLGDVNLMIGSSYNFEYPFLFMPITKEIAELMGVESPYIQAAIYGDGYNLGMTVSLSTTPQCVKIDKKFLHTPDWDENNVDSPAYIANKPFGTTHTECIIEDVIVEGGYDTFSPIKEETWKALCDNQVSNLRIVIDSVEYPLIYEDSSETEILYKVNNKYLVVSRTSSMAYFFNASEFAGRVGLVRIFGTCIIDKTTKLDDKYIDTKNIKIAWSNILDKPFGDASIEAIYFDGDTSKITEYGYMLGDTMPMFHKVSNHPTLLDLLGFTVKITSDRGMNISDRLMAANVIQVTNNVCTFATEDYGFPLISVDIDNCSVIIDGKTCIFDTAGIYAPHPLAVNDYYTLRVYDEYKRVKQLDEKYIPNLSPDWNELKTESKRFIHNKPFGETFEIGEKIGTISYNYDPVATEEIAPHHEYRADSNLNDIIDKLNESSQCFVTIDNKTYLSQILFDGLWYFGDIEFIQNVQSGNIDVTSPLNSEIPFILIVDYLDHICSGSLITDEKVDSYNVTIYEAIETVHQLDDKYIPDTIARKEDIVKTVNNIEPDENGNVTLAIQEGFSGSWNDLEDRPFGETDPINVSVLDNASFMLTESDDSKTIGNYMLEVSDYMVLEENKEYTIVVNGTSYNVIVRSYSESGMTATYLGDVNLMTGGSDNFEYPFLFMPITKELGELMGIESPYVQAAIVGEGYNTGMVVSLSTFTPQYVKIDKKFLHTPDWDENNVDSPSYIANRPFNKFYHVLCDGNVKSSQSTNSITSSIFSNMYYSEEYEIIEGCNYELIINNLLPVRAIGKKVEYDSNVVTSMNYLGNAYLYKLLCEESGESLPDEYSSLLIDTQENYLISIDYYSRDILVLTRNEYQVNTLKLTKLEYLYNQIPMEYINMDYISETLPIGAMPGEGEHSTVLNCKCSDGYHYNNHAYGIGSVASGRGSKAYGEGSFAHGYGNTYGIYSSAFGMDVFANGDYQFVHGKNNIEDNDNKYVYIIGNGETQSHRSNAHTLDWNGNAWYQGSVEATALILKSPNGTRFSITVGDDGVLTSTEIVE